MLVEDPEEVEKEKFFVKLFLKKPPKESRLYLIEPLKELKKPSSNCLSRLWRPEKFFVRGRSKTLDCL